MKKLLAMTSAFVMALSMAACGNSDDDDEEELKPKKTIAETTTDASTAKPDTSTTTTEPSSAPADTTLAEQTEPEQTMDSKIMTYNGDNFWFDIDINVWSESYIKQNDFGFLILDQNLSFKDVIEVRGIQESENYTDEYGDELCKSLKSTYLEMGYNSVVTTKGTYTAAYDTTYPCIQIDVLYTDDSTGYLMKGRRIYLYKDSTCVMISLDALDEEFNSVVEDYYDVINSVYIE